MAKKTTTVFSIKEESNNGGSSFCWVERRTKGYVLMGNEMGEMSGPCATVVGAISRSGFQFGMGYITIDSSLPADELRQALGEVIMGNVNVMWLNGIKHERPTVEAVMAAYEPS